MCLYYKCDLCGAEQPINQVEQQASHKNPLSLRTPLRLPHWTSRPRTDKYKFICLTCDEKFTDEMRKLQALYEMGINNAYDTILNDILEENKK